VDVLVKLSTDEYWCVCEAAKENKS